MLSSVLFAVGSYTDGRPFFEDCRGAGITLCRLNPTGSVSSMGVFHDILNPSYLAINGGAGFIAVSESFSTEGSVVAFDLTEKGLMPRWRTSSFGRATCHVSVNSAFVSVANYLSGTVLLLDEQGAKLNLVAYPPGGQVRSKGTQSHPHQTVMSPCSQWLLVPDLGDDCIWVHNLSTEGDIAKTLSQSTLPPKTGPRHLLFHRSHPLVSVLGEFDGILHTGTWNDKTGEICWFSALKTTSQGQKGHIQASAIREHPVHPVLFTANRGSNEIAAFSVADGKAPIPIATIPAGGETPRDFAISPDGRWMLVACQDSHHVAVHRLDEQTGLPIDLLCHRHPLGSPSCILFLHP